MAIEESFGHEELKELHAIDNFRLSDLEAKATELNLTPAQCVEVIRVVDEINDIIEDVSRGIDVAVDVVDNLIAQEDVVYSVNTLEDCVSEAEDFYETIYEKYKKFTDLIPPSTIKDEGFGEDTVVDIGVVWLDITHNLNVTKMYHHLIQLWWFRHTDDILVLLTWADR